MIELFLTVFSAAFVVTVIRTTTPLLLTANGSTLVGSRTIREGIKAIGYVRGD